MNKKILVLTIVSVLSLSVVSYASDNSDNIEKSKACVEQAREFTRKSDFVNAENKLNEAIKLNNKNDQKLVISLNEKIKQIQVGMDVFK